MDPVNLTPQIVTQAFQEIDNINKLNQSNQRVSQIGSESLITESESRILESRVKINDIKKNMDTLKKINFSYLKESTGFPDFIMRISHAIRFIFYNVKAYRLNTHIENEIAKESHLQNAIQSFEHTLTEAEIIVPGANPEDFFNRLNDSRGDNISDLKNMIKNHLNKLDPNKINEHLFIIAKDRLNNILENCKKKEKPFTDLEQFSPNPDDQSLPVDKIFKSYSKLVEHLFDPQLTPEESLRSVEKMLGHSS
jgi:hypothetical protein